MSTHNDHVGRVAALVGRLQRTLAGTVSGIAFWTAILVPIAYLVFMVRGVATRRQLALFLALLAVNYFALFLGHSYHVRERT